MGIFFSSKSTPLPFRPFTNIFLGEIRRKKKPTECPSQLLTSTMNHRHKTTAMWLAKELCVFTFHYWESFSNLPCVICRQIDTDRRTHPSGSQAALYNTVIRWLQWIHFPLLILFWEIILPGLNLPLQPFCRGGVCVCKSVSVCVCVSVHEIVCVCMRHDRARRRSAETLIQLISQVETSVCFRVPPFFELWSYFAKVIFTWEAHSAFSDSGKLINWWQI